MPAFPSPRVPRRGLALVIVLSFLALLSVLIIAFFTNVHGELQTTRGTMANVTSRQLADSAVQLVMGQIREATSRQGRTAWAAQPGLIRTYGTGSAASADPLAYYKLYSSDNLVVSHAQLTAGNRPWRPADDVTSSWPDRSAQYTDLNEPVLVPDENGPIFTTEKMRAVYPILDPRAPVKIAGLKLVEPPGYAGVNPPPEDWNPLSRTGALAGNPAPMPVKWIYVLNDGTLSAPTGLDATGTLANWTTAQAYKKPTKDNPIVGRIAFWTDDECSKINLNTAAGDEKASGTVPGAFWDTPRVTSTFDQELAASPAVQGEYQRYPGHPATIGLIPVFPGLTRQQLTGLTPRVAYGGSLGGTRRFPNVPGAIPRAVGRLYASVDEILFKQPVANDPQRAENLPGIVTREALDQARFVLTASSRVPEVNLFGRPRVSIWPIHATDSPLTRTPSDRLLAFCSRIGGQAYHFTRGGEDWTNQSRTADLSARNVQLYQYLQKVTASAVPGFGGPKKGFAGKYGALERDQILTEIFDYIRTTNLRDGLLAKLPGGRAYTPSKDLPGSGQALPIKIQTSSGTTKGFGRFGTISEATLLFYVSHLDVTTRKPDRMRAALFFETFCPAQGYAGVQLDYTHLVNGLEKLTIQIGARTENLRFPSNAENRITRMDGLHSRPWSGTEGISSPFYTSTGAFKTIPGTDPDKNYAFISQSDIALLPADQDFIFHGGNLDFSIVWKDSPTGGRPPQAIQRIALNFPASPAADGKRWPLPEAGGAANQVDFNLRIAGLGRAEAATTGSNQNDTGLVDPADLVRSLEPAGAPPGSGATLHGWPNGDLRLLAAREKDVPADVFQPHANYFQLNRHAHSLRLGDGGRYAGATSGKLVQAATYTADSSPDLPSSILTGAMIGSPLNGGDPIPGDWDTGLAAYLDGPYINKPDEGTTTAATSTPLDLPYYTSTDPLDAQTLSSPNRQVSSPVMFGSLSTGVIRELPWQTLLFRPDPNFGGPGSHPGSAAPKDHLLLDLFTMPIVEPYAISEPFSTAGKVNMNYAMAPFSYITRETAIRAALQSTWTMSVETTDTKYKSGAGAAAYRTRIDEEQTLRQFQQRFDSNQIFVSASEICDLELVPQGTRLAEMKQYWAARQLSGDNMREMPYTHLYPLLTTKSNTYTVHFRVQALKKLPSTAADLWDEKRDRVVSEYRGSSIIERYIDPDDPSLPDFATLPLTDERGQMDQYYRTRIVSSQKFTP